MKKHILSITALTLSVSVLLFTSCAGKQNMGDTSETTSGTAKTLSYEEAEQIFEKIMTPTGEGAFVLEDNTAYAYEYCTDKYALIGKNNLIYIIELDDPDNKELICSDITCSHTDIRCPAFSAYPFCVVQPEGSDELIIYYFFTFDLFEDIGGYHLEDVQNPHMLFEYNIRTGERRTVTLIGYNGEYKVFPGDSSTYYDGTLYFTGSDWDDVDIHYFVSSLNVVTGEVKKLDLGIDHTFVGIYENYVCIAATDGSIWRCGLDLSDPELVAEIGSALKKPWEYMNRVSMNGSRVFFCTVEGWDGSSPNDEEEDFYSYTPKTLHYLDLAAPDTGVHDIADDVYNFSGTEKYVYFTKYDPQEYGYYGEIEISSLTGGTLYRYDIERDETTVVFEDCGGDIEYIQFVNDEKIIFNGRYYGVFETGFHYTGRGYGLFMYEFDNGACILIDEHYK